MPTPASNRSPDLTDATPGDDDLERAGGTAGRWLRWTGGPLTTGSGFESTRYLAKWLVLSGAIGVVAGVGAIAFYVASEGATRFFLGTLVGYLPPTPVGEGQPVLMPFERLWLLPLVVGLGAILSGVLVFTRARAR